MKKIVETEPEPPFTEVAESSRSLDLLVSVNADYCKFKCKAESVHFKDTLMLQTRVYALTLQNKGSIELDYSWQLLMESQPHGGGGAHQAGRSVTFATHANTDRPMTAGTELVSTRCRPGPGLVNTRRRPSTGSVSTRFRPCAGLVSRLSRPRTGSMGTAYRLSSLLFSASAWPEAMFERCLTRALCFSWCARRAAWCV